MVAIAGAILIHASCVLMAGGKDNFDTYALQRILAVVGTGLMATDFTTRFREF